MKRLFTSQSTLYTVDEVQCEARVVRCVDRTLPPTEGPVGDASKRSRLKRIYKGHHAPPKTGRRIETDEIRVDGLIGQRRMVISGFMYLCYEIWKS